MATTAINQCNNLIVMDGRRDESSFWRAADNEISL